MVVKQVPCKTFMVGEYAVLEGGEALGLATKPGFSLITQKMHYHPDSAVAQFLKTTHFFEVQSTAPGGFGKSTAEFIFAYLEKNKSAHLNSIVNAYLDLYQDQNRLSQKPSGADLVIQSLGHVVHVKSKKSDSVSLQWPFAQQGFFLVSTGLKIATHDHLMNLDRKKLAGLSELSQAVAQTFVSTNSQAFIEGLTAWKATLIERDLIHPEAANLMSHLQEKMAARLQKDFIIKQCGAFGADVMIIIFENDKKNDIRSILIENNLNIVASESDLMNGALTGEQN